MTTITELTNKYTEIDNAKKAAFAAIIEKGVAVPDGTKLDGMADLIRSIPTGGSGTSIETCEVSITFIEDFHKGVFPTYAIYTTVEDEKIVNRTLDSILIVFTGGTATVTINCIVGTNLYISGRTQFGGSFITSNNITLNGTVDPDESVWEFIVNSGPTATIEAVD
jgi:hypothetical protein